MAKRNFSEMRSGIPIVPKKEPQKKPNPVIDKENAIQRRAYEIFLERGAKPGSDQTDWFQAEKEIKTGYNIGG